MCSSPFFGCGQDCSSSLVICPLTAVTLQASDATYSSGVVSTGSDGTVAVSGSFALKWSDLNLGPGLWRWVRFLGPFFFLLFVCLFKICQNNAAAMSQVIYGASTNNAEEVQGILLDANEDTIVTTQPNLQGDHKNWFQFSSNFKKQSFQLCSFDRYNWGKSGAGPLFWSQLKQGTNANQRMMFLVDHGQEQNSFMMDNSHKNAFSGVFKVHSVVFTLAIDFGVQYAADRAGGGQILQSEVDQLNANAVKFILDSCQSTSCLASKVR